MQWRDVLLSTAPLLFLFIHKSIAAKTIAECVDAMGERCRGYGFLCGRSFFCSSCCALTCGLCQGHRPEESVASNISPASQLPPQLLVSSSPPLPTTTTMQPSTSGARITFTAFEKRTVTTTEARRSEATTRIPQRVNEPITVKIAEVGRPRLRTFHPRPQRQTTTKPSTKKPRERGGISVWTQVDSLPLPQRRKTEKSTPKEDKRPSVQLDASPTRRRLPRPIPRPRQRNRWTTARPWRIITWKTPRPKIRRTTSTSTSSTVTSTTTAPTTTTTSQPPTLPTTQRVLPPVTTPTTLRTQSQELTLPRETPSLPQIPWDTMAQARTSTTQLSSYEQWAKSRGILSNGYFTPEDLQEMYNNFLQATTKMPIIMTESSSRSTQATEAVMRVTESSSSSSSSASSILPSRTASTISPEDKRKEEETLRKEWTEAPLASIIDNYYDYSDEDIPPILAAKTTTIEDMSGKEDSSDGFESWTDPVPQSPPFHGLAPEEVTQSPSAESFTGGRGFFVDSNMEQRPGAGNLQSWPLPHGVSQRKESESPLQSSGAPKTKSISQTFSRPAKSKPKLPSTSDSWYYGGPSIDEEKRDVTTVASEEKWKPETGLGKAGWEPRPIVLEAAEATEDYPAYPVYHRPQ